MIIRVAPKRSLATTTLLSQLGACPSRLGQRGDCLRVCQRWRSSGSRPPRGTEVERDHERLKSFASSLLADPQGQVIEAAQEFAKVTQLDQIAKATKADVVAKGAADSVQTVLETGRLGFNDVLKRSLGLEVVRNKPRQWYSTKEKKKRAVDKDCPDDSGFWNPYAANSPFVNRADYLRQYQLRNGEAGWEDIVPEEDIVQYVDALCEDGSLKSLRGLPSMIMPRTLYTNVVRCILHVLKAATDSIDGTLVFGRKLHLLKRQSVRSRWRVSQMEVQAEVVEKLARRALADHQDIVAAMPEPLQELMYHNVITLIFRVAFDIVDSMQLRVLGHTVTVHIEADEMLAAAPGWEVSLDSGVFGRFDSDEKRKFVSEFVDDLLSDESINLLTVPDVIEKQIYCAAVMVAFDLVETAANHCRLHLAGVAYRPALEDVEPEKKSSS